MNVGLEFLAEHGPRLALGVSAVLSVGCLLVWSVRQPVYKQRLAELSVFAALLWLGLAVLPMDRQTTTTITPVANEDVSESKTPSPGSAPTLSVPMLTSAEPPLASVEARFDPIDVSNLAIPAIAPASDVGLPVSPSVVEAPLLKIQWAAFGYLAASALSLIALAASGLRLRRLAWRCKQPDARTLLHWESLDPPERCRLLVSPTETPPLSFGVIRPTVCIPESLQQNEDRSLMSVLAHELAHIRHGDAVGRTVFNLGLPFFALHPLYWMLRSEAVFASELRADAAAAESEGEAEYVESLLSVFQRRGGRVRPLLSASTVWSSQSAFSRRMTMLLERKNPVRQETPKTWKAFVGLAAVAGAAAFASQFGVVYAQVEKAKSNDPVKSTVVTPLRAVEASGVARFNPIEVGGKRVETTISADGRYAKLATSDLGSHSDDGPAHSNNLSISIADRKARLAAAKITNQFQPEVLIRMEVELIHLEAAKKIEAYENELRNAEAKLRNAAGDLQEAQAELSDAHPTRQKLTTEVHRTEQRIEQLRKMIDATNHEADARSKRAADAIMWARKEPSNSVPSSNLLPSVTPATSTAAGNDIAAAMQEIARLKKENDDLKRRLSAGQPSAVKTKEAPVQTKPSMNAVDPNGMFRQLQQERESHRDLLSQLQVQSTKPVPVDGSLTSMSVPLLKHRLRMAQTEPQILERRLAWAIKESERMEKLHKSGGASFEEVAKVRMQLEVTQAELEKAKVEIGSLMKLIEELENSNQKPAGKTIDKAGR